MDPQPLESACLTNQYLQNLCKDEHFWYQKVLRYLGPNIAKWKPVDITYQKQYRDLVYLQIPQDEERLIEDMDEYVVYTRPDILELLFERGIDATDFTAVEDILYI
jgi:hypothetical protein